MRRVKSTATFVDISEENPGNTNPAFFDDTPRDLLKAYRTVLQQLDKVKRELKDLRKHVQGVAEESSQWTLKYSRRIVMVSNILLASYILGNRLLDIVNHSSKSMIFQLINPFPWLFPPKKKKSKQSTSALDAYGRFRAKKNSSTTTKKPQELTLDDNLPFVLIRLLWQAGVRSGLLMFATYWLFSADAWKRNSGILISFLMNVHLAYRSDVATWTIYFNMFSLIMYLIARYYSYIPSPDTMLSRISSVSNLSALKKTFSMDNLASAGKQSKTQGSNTQATLADDDDEEDE